MRTLILSLWIGTERIWTFFAFIHVPNLTKVRVVERERVEGEPRVLETTIGHIVPLLPIAPDRADSDLEASVNRLFDEGGSSAGGEQEAGTSAGVRIVSGEDVAVEEPRCLQKKRQATTDAGGSSHPLKKLRSDYIAPSVAPSAGKAPFGLRDLLARSMLNVESGAEFVTTLPFVTSYVSATPEHDSGVPSAPERFVISSDSSHHSANASKAEGISIIRSAVILPVVTEAVITTQVASIPSTATLEPSTKVVTPVHASMFQDSNSAGTVRPDVVGSSQAPGKELSLGSREDEEVEDLNARLLLKEAEAAEDIHLRADASNFEAIEKSIWDEVTALKGRNAILKKERDALDGKVTDLAASVTGKKRELTTLDSQLTVHKLEVVSSEFQEKLSNYFYPHLLTTIFGRRWLLTHGMELAVTKFLHSSEYLSALGAAIGKAIEKGMQDGLAVGITHGAEGRTLADVAAYNPFAEADYISALQRLQNINFSLLAELRSSKDASVDAIMNILRLEDNLAKRLGLNESQPFVDQLMVPIYHSPDRVVVGATSQSFALDVSDARVRKIRENIASQRPALRDVFIPISEPFSAEVLMGTGGTSDTVHASITTALSTTLAFVNTVAPITVDDYGVVGTDNQAGADADSFPNVDDADLNMPLYFVRIVGRGRM
uniref:Transposase (Putative), gypsy type n=1 Tax=Tanacetum cinerariifolium TaxID=118510 RepID=A0A699HCM7_TANCI|nr:hypothetical protein [Tanacetum cinerariifolium]